MAKSSGLGDALLVDGYDLSGDTQEVKGVRGGPSPIDVTGIDKSAMERVGGIRDGAIEWTSHFNTAASHSHPVLSALPTTDRYVAYLRGTTLGNAAAACYSRQVNYDMTRGTDGKLTLDVQALADGFGVEWGYQLTAGLRTDTTATNGSTFDRQLFDLLDLNGGGLGTSTALSWQAYLFVTAFSGTSVTVTLQDSADNASYAGLTGGAFTAATTIGAQRLAGASGATVRRYVRATTSGTFTSATFSVLFVPNTSVAVAF
jgi:hypothetical protein